MEREFRKIKASFKAAWCGIVRATNSERNFRIHICVIFYVLLFAILGHVSLDKYPILFICFGMVLGTELVNSATELLCDVVTHRFDKTLGAIKDMAAGAVLVCAIFAAAAGLCVFLKPAVILSVLTTFKLFPWLAVLIALTIPFAVWFICGKFKKSQ